MANTSPLQSNVVYSDFSTKFEFHPIKKDLVLITNEDSVKRSIRNIVMTNYYERNDPTLGTNLDAQLFELATPQAQIVLENSITSAINNHEPRAQLISVAVAVDPSSNSASVTIVFTLINSSQSVTLTVILERIR